MTLMLRSEMWFWGVRNVMAYVTLVDSITFIYLQINLHLKPEFKPKH
jgi:hypothetical protein